VEFAKFVKESWPVHAGNMSKLLKDNGGTYLVGNDVGVLCDSAHAGYVQITWVDFLVAEMHSLFSEAVPHLLADYPLVKQHIDMVMNVKNVREYIATRPPSRMLADLL
jgi:hypothetical protein